MMNSNTTDQASKHRQLLVSQADLARRAGRSRGRISEACKDSLREAMVGRRVDLAHPATISWAAKRGLKLADLLKPSERASHFRQRRKHWLSMREIDRLLGHHGRDSGGLDLDSFALDIGTPELLELAAASPFKRDKNGEIIDDIVGDGGLGAALVGEALDQSHPAAQFFMARLLGRVPEPEDDFITALCGKEKTS